MKKVRIRILSGIYKNETGLMDSCGWITFTDSTDKIHNSEIQWKFLDF